MTRVTLDTEADLRAELALVFPSITSWALDDLISLYPLGEFGSYANIMTVMGQTLDLDGKVRVLGSCQRAHR